VGPLEKWRRRGLGRCDWSHGDGEEPMSEESVCSSPGKKGGTWPLCREQHSTIFSPSMWKSLLRPINFQNQHTCTRFICQEQPLLVVPLYLFLQATKSKNFSIQNTTTNRRKKK